MQPTGKAYNALTGVELRAAILNEVGRALDRAGLDSAALTYPSVSWSWDLKIWQRDTEGEPVSDVPERYVKAGELASKISSGAQNIIAALSGGSKRFKNQPPTPTEVREAEGLEKPGA